MDSVLSGIPHTNTLATGCRLGRYEIRSRIGAGGMGEVYLAQDTELDRPVALKFLLPELASDFSRLLIRVSVSKTRQKSCYMKFEKEA